MWGLLEGPWCYLDHARAILTGLAKVIEALYSSAQPLFTGPEVGFHCVRRNRDSSVVQLNLIMGEQFDLVRRTVVSLHATGPSPRVVADDYICRRACIVVET